MFCTQIIQNAPNGYVIVAIDDWYLFWTGFLEKIVWFAVLQFLLTHECPY